MVEGAENGSLGVDLLDGNLQFIKAIDILRRERLVDLRSGE